jgi:hypothetical protein
MLPYTEDHAVDMEKCSTGINLKNFETKINKLKTLHWQYISTCTASIGQGMALTTTPF